MTDVFEFSEYERDKFIYEFTDMTPEQVIEKKAKLEAYNKEQEEKKLQQQRQKLKKLQSRKKQYQLLSLKKKISQKNNVCYSAGADSQIIKDETKN